MTGMWVRRDPVTQQIREERTDEEMSALLRKSNPASPEYVPTEATRVFLIDRHTAGVEVAGSDEPHTPFRWEFDLYEGWYDSGHSVPTPSIVAAAAWMGCSMVDYLCSSGAVTAQARRMVAAERAVALRTAEALLAALRELHATDLDDVPPFTRQWHADRCGTVEQVLLDVVTRLSDGDAGRAKELLAAAFDSGATITETLPRHHQAWYHADHVRRARNTT
jgi:hypothetical protein